MLCSASSASDEEDIMQEDAAIPNRDGTQAGDDHGILNRQLKAICGHQSSTHTEDIDIACHFCEISPSTPAPEAQCLASYFDTLHIGVKRPREAASEGDETLSCSTSIGALGAPSSSSVNSVVTRKKRRRQKLARHDHESRHQRQPRSRSHTTASSSNATRLAAPLTSHSLYSLQVEICHEEYRKAKASGRRQRENLNGWASNRVPTWREGISRVIQVEPANSFATSNFSGGQ